MIKIFSTHTCISFNIPCHGSFTSDITKPSQLNPALWKKGIIPRDQIYSSDPITPAKVPSRSLNPVSSTIPVPFPIFFPQLPVQPSTHVEDRRVSEPIALGEILLVLFLVPSPPLTPLTGNQDVNLGFLRHFSAKESHSSVLLWRRVGNFASSLIFW